MWTHTSNKSSHWTPNHFVLQDEGSNPINIDSFVDFPPLSPSPSNKMSVDISFLSTACDNDKRSSPSSDMSDNEAFSVLEIPTAMYTSSPKSLVSEHPSSDLSDDTVVTSLKQDSDNDVWPYLSKLGWPRGHLSAIYVAFTKQTKRCPTVKYYFWY